MGNKIILVAGNYEQAKYWIERNIISVTSKKMLDVRLWGRGEGVENIYVTGNPEIWLDQEYYDELWYLIERRKLSIKKQINPVVEKPKSVDIKTLKRSLIF